MLTRMAMIAAVFLLGACTGDDAAPQEPVQAGETAVPDAPGGETAEKPAGEGEAGALPAKEKSTSPAAAVAAAAREGEGGDGPMVVTSGALSVRSGGGMKHPVVRTIQKGEKVDAKNCGSVWCEIGPNEFVSKKFLAPQ